MTSNPITSNSIQDYFAGKLKSLPVFVYDEIDSTNNEGKRRITNDGLKEGLFITGHQTGGRGRSGHTFYSPKEGLYMSLVFTPDSLVNASHATTKAAVAVYEAIKELYSLSPQIKWVNDIYLDGMKICGILTEAVTSGINSGSLVVGIGINFSATDVPEEIKNIMGFLPKREDIDRNRLAASIINKLYYELENMDSTEYIKKYRSASMLTGKNITYYEGEIQKSAFVSDIDDEAGLVVILPSGEKTVLRNGEVFTVRELK